MTSNYAANGTEFIVASEAMNKFMGMVERVARHVGTVLIVGETGAGKELIARIIHERSTRSSKPFVEINCAALPENLVESELFGYEKGAFSGAEAAKPGLFELANSGTIFLDEIGELDLRLQVKLLRILDRAPFYRLGGHRKMAVDVRVVAATNRNLKEEVSAGRFRKDLYHRLSQFELCVPPLRERPEDVVALAQHFLDLRGSDLHFCAEALQALQSYSWPGNVRELQNVVNKVMVSALGPEIGASEVGREFTNVLSPDDAHEDHLETTTDLDKLEASAVRKALQMTGGHRGRAAVQLGISRRTLSRKLRQHRLSSGRCDPPSALGSLGCEQQQAFRANLKIPVSLRTSEGQEYHCIAVNLSAGGMGLEDLTDVLGHHARLIVAFRLPDSDRTMEVPARLAWTCAQGRAGITFTDSNTAVRQELNGWLFRRMTEEGWTVVPESAETSGQHAASAISIRTS